MPKPITSANERLAIWSEARGRHERTFWDSLTHDPKDQPSFNVYDAEDWHGQDHLPPVSHRAPEPARPSLRDRVHQDLTQGFDQAEEHMSNPFKAITHYDEYVEPYLNPDDPQAMERARQKRRYELEDMGRDTVEGLGHALMQASIDEIKRLQRQAGHHTPRYIILPHWDPQAAYEILHDHNDDMGYHTERLALQVGPELMDEAKQGGFTLHDHVGDAPTSGYMVSLNKDTEDKTPMSQLTPQHIQQFVTKNARALQDPNAYLGGWLDGGNFYLDVSHHIPDLNRATTEAVRAKQLGIYDLAHGRTIDTDEAGWMTGNPGIVGGKHGDLPHPAQGRRHGSSQPAAGRSWVAAAYARGVQHPLLRGGGRRLGSTIVPPPGASPNFDPAQASFTGETLGSHGAQKWKSKDGSEWLVKQAQPGQEFVNEGEFAAHTLADKSGLSMPLIQQKVVGGKLATAQYMAPGTAAFPDKGVDPNKLSPNDLLTIQKHHALDWLVGNHDAHPGQWIRDPQGHLIGLDKGQAFKFYANDRLHWNHNPNGDHVGESEPIYNTLHRAMATGDGPVLNDPRKGELAQYIQGLQNMSDGELLKAVEPYAVGAKKAGFLGKNWGFKSLDKKIRMGENNLPAFYDAVRARRDHLMDDMAGLYDRAMAHRMTGMKVAKVAMPMPLPEGLTFQHHRREDGSGVVTAHLPESEPWGGPSPQGQVGYLAYAPDGEIVHVVTQPQYRRHGIADAMWDHARALNPDLHHSQTQTGLGKMWAEHEEGRSKASAKQDHLPNPVISLPRVCSAKRWAMAAPDPTTLQDTHQQLGSHGSRVFNDPTGQPWLSKRPPQGEEFRIPLEVATSRLQHEVGLPGQEVHAIPLGGTTVTVHKMWPEAQQAFPKPPRLQDVSPEDLQILQKHQALDWLIANHDPHVGNFLRTGEGQLVGIDKGQAFKYFGRDRLDPHFHPNFYAREPIYNNLWREFANGSPAEMHDPRSGPVGEFVNRLQSIPDDHLKELFRPYAEATAKAGLLATGGPEHPDRKLGPLTVQPNNPEAFLDAVVARKNNLGNDLGELYDKMATLRAQHQQRHTAAPFGGLFKGLTNSSPATPNALTDAIPEVSNFTNHPPSSIKPAKPDTPKPGDPLTGNTTGDPVSSDHKGPRTPSFLEELGHPDFSNFAGQSGHGSAPGSLGGGVQQGEAQAGGGTGGPSTPINYSPSAGVDQWQHHIEEGLRRNNLPVTPEYINRVKKQMQTESGGNPRAINQIDENAKAGHPSQGLLQTIPSTFQQYHLPGDSNDIYDPQANIDSAIGYARARYGPTLMDSSGNGMGSGHGY